MRQQLGLGVSFSFGAKLPQDAQTSYTFSALVFSDLVETVHILTLSSYCDSCAAPSRHQLKPFQVFYRSRAKKQWPLMLWKQLHMVLWRVTVYELDY